jgi:hypothetical protein
MSMDDILKLLVESRQEGQSQSPSQGTDPMTQLIGGLLGGGSTGGQGDAVGGILGSLLGGTQSTTSGGGQQQDAVSGMLGSLLGGGGQQSTTGGGGQTQDALSGMLGSLLGGGQSLSGSQTGLGGIMSLLEMVTGAGQQGIGQSSLTANNPIMGLIQPFITPLANKLKISPQLAMIVVSFVLQKMLAHHPTSGRDSTQFNLDQMFSQLNSGKLDPNLLKNSGMVEELSSITGMNQTMAAKSLNTAFTMVGTRALKVGGPPSVNKVSTTGNKRAA